MKIVKVTAFRVRLAEVLGARGTGERPEILFVRVRGAFRFRITVRIKVAV